MWNICPYNILFELSIFFNKLKFIKKKPHRKRENKHREHSHKHINTRFRFMREQGPLDSDHPQSNTNSLCQIQHNPRQILSNLTDPFHFRTGFPPSSPIVVAAIPTFANSSIHSLELICSPSHPFPHCVFFFLMQRVIAMEWT